MTNQSLFNFAEKPQPFDASADWISWNRAMIDVLKPKSAADAALLYDNLLDNYKLEKCKNIADYAEQLSRARGSIHSFDSR
ncbi:hypothetical protein E4U59_004097 [Claviceps monticola]|nr:hypothetical protein E4U59_004097 [Claviceps monticola]